MTLHSMNACVCEHKNFHEKLTFPLENLNKKPAHVKCQKQNYTTCSNEFDIFAHTHMS